MFFSIAKQCTVRNVPYAFLSHNAKVVCSVYPRLYQECASPSSAYPSYRHRVPLVPVSLTVPGYWTPHRQAHTSPSLEYCHLPEWCNSCHARKTVFTGSLCDCGNVKSAVRCQTGRHFHMDNVNRHAKFKTHTSFPDVQKTTETLQRTKERVKETVEEKVRGFVKRENIVTVPNMLTGLRIAMTPFLGYLVLQQCYPMACVIFVITGITDVLDGWVARTFENQTSAFGSFLDPLADKLLISVLFVTLTMVNLIPLPLTALVIARDVCLIAGAFYVRYISILPPLTLKKYFDVKKATAQLQPTVVSKVNTAVQLSLVTFSLCAPVFSFTDHPAMHALWFLTAGTTIASGIGYIFAKDTFKILQQTRKTGL